MSFTEQQLLELTACSRMKSTEMLQRSSFSSRHAQAKGAILVFKVTAAAAVRVNQAGNWKFITQDTFVNKFRSHLFIQRGREI